MIDTIWLMREISRLLRRDRIKERTPKNVPSDFVAYTSRDEKQSSPKSLLTNTSVPLFNDGKTTVNIVVMGNPHTALIQVLGENKRFTRQHRWDADGLTASDWTDVPVCISDDFKTIEGPLGKVEFIGGKMSQSEAIDPFTSNTTRRIPVLVKT